MGDRISDRRRAERFAQLLDEADGGPRHHVRTDVDHELAALVAVGQRVSSAPPVVDVDVVFRSELRARLLATAEREGIGTGREPVRQPFRPTTERPARRLALPRFNGPRARARGAIIIGIAAGAIAVSGISAASENAMPGDALYGMKRSTERAQLALTGSDLNRGQLFLDFAHTRLAEAAALRSDPVGFAAVLDDMDADTRQGAKLLATSAAQRQDGPALDAIGSFLAGQRRQLSALGAGAGPSQQERADASVSLLDQIKSRTDALRAGMACGVEPSVRVDDLGPLPRSCAAGRQPAASQTGTGPSGTSTDQHPGGRATSQPRAGRSEPARSPVATTPGEQTRPAPAQRPHRPN